jgi:hypothetical protein
MDINRNNYEGFLLQYVDGELDAAGKKAVEAFVRLNPDLQEELLMLQQTVLQPVPCTFEHKAMLYKTSEATQTQLLQYLDGELAPAEAELLAQQITTDPAIQQEWNILQKTQLDAQEVIVFADKASLYRQAPGRVVGLKWWRVAAAALLLGFGVWGGVALMKSDNKGSNIDSGLTTVTSNNGTQPLVTPPNNVNTDTNQSATDNNSIATTGDNNTIVQPVTKQTIANPISIKDNNATVAQQSPKKVRWSTDRNAIMGQNDLDRVQKKENKIISQNFNTNNGNEIATNNVTPTNSQLEPAVATPAEKMNAEKNVNAENALKGNTALFAANEMNDVGASNSYLATSSKKVRKSGLLRKVSRFFQRSLNNRGEGDGLKIAGFEFAVR